MKTVTLMPVGGDLDVTTDTALVDGLLARSLKVDMACGGRGVCASCHVFVREGADSLSPVGPKEARTLRLLATVTPESRLACQSRVTGDGLVVEVPEGMYVQSADGLDGLVGERAGFDYLHPLTGRALIPKGKVITRSVFGEFVSAARELKLARESA